MTHASKTPGAQVRVALAGFLAATVAQVAIAQDKVPAGTSFPMGEQHTILDLKPAFAKRVFVLEPLFPALVASKVWVIDGEKQKVESVMSGGYLMNFALAPDQSKVYFFDTYWSMGYRGTRRDMLTIYDGKKLTVDKDVDLPGGRFLVVPKKQNAEISTDGRFAYSYNLAPSTTVSVVDTQTQKLAGEIEVPGCGMILPSGPTRFSTVCSDGTLFTVKFDPATIKAQTMRDGPFFDAENNPVFEHMALDKKRGHVHFVTYEGDIITADLSKDKPAIGKAWSMLGAEDKAESWHPGGWQLINIHRPTQRLFVLMHKGEKWTHKQAGEEVWVFDLASKKRVQRIHLKEHAISIALSQDADPYLFTQTEAASLITYKVSDGSEVGEMKFGISPFLLFTLGD
jgi:methylamine dehydrogenase heavy chain